MKTLCSHALAVGVSLLLFMTPSRAAEAWGTDYQAALQTAAKENRPVLVDFTGSDWCGWCIRLSEETFSKPEFLDYAKDNLVLLEADYPQSKEQSAAVKAQNEKLQEEFSVEGFPTLVLLGKDGKEIARHVGYLPGGPSAMIDWIKKETSAN